MNDKLKNVVVTIAFVFIIVIFFIANIIKKDLGINTENTQSRELLKMMIFFTVSAFLICEKPQKNMMGS